MDAGKCCACVGGRLTAEMEGLRFGGAGARAFGALGLACSVLNCSGHGGTEALVGMADCESPRTEPERLGGGGGGGFEAIDGGD